MIIHPIKMKTPSIAVEAVKCFHLILSQAKVKHIDVFFYTAFAYRFRDSNNTALNLTKIKNFRDWHTCLNTSQQFITGFKV